MLRRILFAGLLLGPIAIVLHYVTDLSETALFVLAAARADPARLADRRGDRARGRAHRARDRRLPQRDVRQRARADHRADRGQRGLDRGRPRLADGLGRREPAARARVLARRRPARRDRALVELPLLRDDRDRDRPLPDPVDPALARRSGRARDRRSLRPGLDRAARRLRRRHRSTRCGATAGCTSSSDEEIEAWSLRTALLVLVRRDGRHRARRRDPRRLARGLRREGRAVGLLRRRGDRRDRRERGRARRRGRRRRPRQDQARGRDRALVVGAGGRVPDPRRRAALVADRAARARLPQGRDRSRSRGLLASRWSTLWGGHLVAGAAGSS